MAVRWSHPGSAGERHRAGPPELALPGLRRVVGADDPSFQMFEVIADRDAGRAQGRTVLFGCPASPSRRPSTIPSAAAPTIRSTGRGAADRELLEAAECLQKIGAGPRDFATVSS